MGWGSSLGGIFKTATRGLIDIVPGGGAALSAYDAYNRSQGRVGAFSPAGTKPGGGLVPPGAAPPPLPTISGTPGNAVARIASAGGGGMAMTPEAGTGAGQVFQTPDGQWHTKSWRGTKGHMTKGTKRNPPHWTNRRRPRMNPMNVHAARRSVRRLVSGEKLFRKIFRIMHHHRAAVAPKRSFKKR